MAIIYYPQSSVIFQRTTTVDNFTEVALNVPPNSIFLFTGSIMYTASLDIAIANSASWASQSLSSSYVVSASYALNGGNGGGSGGVDIIQMRMFL